MATAYECAYCAAQTATTDDHIPAKAFFAKGSRPALVTVKACSACNQGASADDEYFRDTVVKHHRVAELPQAQAQVAAMLRAAAHPRKQGYAEAILQSFVDVEVRTPAGLHLGVQPAFRVNGDRLRKTAERYIRGLHRHEFGYRVPEGAVVSVAVNPQKVFEKQADVLRVFTAGTTRVVQAGVFFYSFVRPADNPAASAWLLVFFEEFAVLGTVRPPKADADAPAA
jgi:hypothetical protein